MDRAVLGNGCPSGEERGAPASLAVRASAAEGLKPWVVIDRKCPLRPLSALGGGWTIACKLATGIRRAALPKAINSHPILDGNPLGTTSAALPWVRELIHHPKGCHDECKGSLGSNLHLPAVQRTSALRGRSGPGLYFSGVPLAVLPTKMGSVEQSQPNRAWARWRRPTGLSQRGTSL
jgi:hypothetical protein